MAKWKPEKDKFQEAISGYLSGNKNIAKQTETAIGIHCDMFIVCLEKALVFLNSKSAFFPNDAFLYLSYETQIVRKRKSIKILVWKTPCCITERDVALHAQNRD